MRFLIFIVLMTACGGEEPKCLGPVGHFSGVPELNLNNCSGVPWVLEKQELIITEDNQYACGTHQVGVASVSVDRVTLCGKTSKKYLIVKEDGYQVQFIVEIDCKSSPYFSGKCLAFWKTSLQPVQ